MTKLEAIQLAMMKLGILPVNALETGSASTAANIERVLDMRTKIVCEEGWHFNSCDNVELTPTSIQSIGTSPVTVHLTEGVYQQSHPMVLDGTVQLMPTMNLTYGNLDSSLSPLFYLCPEGGNPTQMAHDIADAIGAAKAAGKRAIMQVIDSARIWTTFSDAAPIWGSTHGELNHTNLITAIHAGQFTYTTESNRITTICAEIIARLDANWGGARPDGIYHDIETGPTDGNLSTLIANGDAEAALALTAVIGDTTPVVGMQARITAKISAGCPSGGRSFSVVPNAFAYDAVMRELIYATIKAEWTALGFTCPHYIWATPTASAYSHGFTDNGVINEYACNVDAGTMYYFASTDVDSLATDLAARDATKPFVPHLSLPRGTPYALTADVEAMLSTCRDSGVTDVFMFVNATTDTTQNALISGYLTAITSGIEYAMTPALGRVASDSGNIMLEDIADSATITEIMADGIDRRRSIVIASDRLYDKDANTDIFSGTLTVSYVTQLPFASLPSDVQTYVACETAARFNESYGQRERQSGLDRDALRARARARGADSRIPEANILGTEQVRGIRGTRMPFPQGPWTSEGIRPV